ncbi:MAG: hypothetical protein AAF196_04510 [Planctomycetota bacterium]
MSSCDRVFGQDAIEAIGANESTNLGILARYRDPADVERALVAQAIAARLRRRSDRCGGGDRRAARHARRGAGPRFECRSGDGDNAGRGDVGDCVDRSRIMNKKLVGTAVLGTTLATGGGSS